MPPREDDGGDFAGIDPVLMRAMIKDLETAKGLVDAKVPGLKDAFGKVGLSTKPIVTLTGIAGWINGELPMLNRRQGMAEQLSKENNQFGFTGTMVETDWEGLFKSKAEAEAKAKELAAQYEEPAGFPDDVWEQIEKYQNDPDFAEAFLKALGPEKAARAATWARDGADSGNRVAAFATLMATASHRGVIDDAWLKKFGVMAPGTAPGGGEGPDLHLLATLIKHGVWNTDTLVTIGTKALTTTQPHDDNRLKADILDGISNNPLAANRLYCDNFDLINAMASGGMDGWTSGDPRFGDPLGRFMAAATTGAREVYGRMQPTGRPNPADVLISRLLQRTQISSGFPTDFEGVKKALDGVAGLAGEVAVPNPALDVQDGEKFEFAYTQPQPDPNTPIDWASVSQGMLGDCYLLAAVQAELKRNPYFLRDRMVRNPDGTYTVTFYKDGKPVKITVTGDTAKYKGANDKAFVDPPLLAIYEKAYAQFKGSGSYAKIEGGEAVEPWPDINGKKVEELEDLSFKNLKAMSDQGVPMTVSTPGDGMFDDDARTGPGGQLVTDHVYSVKEVKINDRGEEVVVLVNPWGKNASAPHEVEVPLSWLKDGVGEWAPRWQVKVAAKQ
ncbi:hypothetical protein GCM10022226_72430 [Sphaerisporangium flaviroseum]|uniref:Calpain catalytic domain-containing protein n=1 Tax=Sphaerisporangium flaviroseum TaxID=509199 RepID=A0ABP7JBQ1_9ACTN